MEEKKISIEELGDLISKREEIKRTERVRFRDKKLDDFVFQGKDKGQVITFKKLFGEPFSVMVDLFTQDVNKNNLYVYFKHFYPTKEEIEKLKEISNHKKMDVVIVYDGSPGNNEEEEHIIENSDVFFEINLNPSYEHVDSYSVYPVSQLSVSFDGKYPPDFFPCVFSYTKLSNLDIDFETAMKRKYL